MASHLIGRETPKSRYGMISSGLVVAVVAFGVACSTPPAEETEEAPAEAVELAPVPGVWPPPESPAIAENAEVVVLDAGAKPEFCGDSMVFDDSKMVAAPSGYERVGYIVCGGEYELPFNIFAIEEAGDGFVNNFYEVVAFDGNRTRIKIDEDKNQGVVMEVDQDARYGGQAAYKLTADYVGTSLTYNGNVYELGPEGWSVGGKLVHAFPAP